MHTGRGKTMERHFKQEKLKIEVLNIREEREHFHQDIELLFVLEGTLDVAMGEQTTHMQPEADVKNFIIIFIKRIFFPGHCHPRKY